MKKLLICYVLLAGCGKDVHGLYLDKSTLMEAYKEAAVRSDTNTMKLISLEIRHCDSMMYEYSKQ